MELMKNTDFNFPSALKSVYSSFRKAADGFFSSAYFPVITAAVTLISYYMGWDLVTIYYMGACYVLIFLFCSDVTPAFCVFLFMDIIISVEHTPSSLATNIGAEVSDFYMQSENLTRIIVTVALAVSALFVRAIYETVKRRLFPSGMFLSLCALALAVSLNGVFSSSYTAMDFPYGLLIGLCFAAIFFVVKTGTKVNKRTFEKIAFYFLVLFLALAFELVEAYLTRDGIISDGKIKRSKLFFGWGMYNTIGMLFCMCMPALFYLSIIKKHGWVFTFLALADEFCIIFSMSRQSILFGTLMCVICFVWLMVKRGGYARCVNLFILWLYLLGFAVFITLDYEFFRESLDSLLVGLSSGGGRFTLWKQAWVNFKSFPAFGVGFFADLTGDPWFPGIELIPRMYHSTVMQMLGSCGIFGGAAYLLHRVITIRSYFKNITVERTFVAFSILSLLLVSLLDNHMFYFFPTIIYSALIAFLSSSEKKDRKGRFLRKND